MLFMYAALLRKVVIMTGTLTSDRQAEEEAQLALVRELAQDLGRLPGRPLIMKNLGVTDTRARKLIEAAKESGLDPRAPLTRHGGTSQARFLAPAGAAPGQGAPAGATLSRPEPPAVDHQAPGVIPSQGEGPSRGGNPPSEATNNQQVSADTTTPPPPASPPGGEAGGPTNTSSGEPGIDRPAPNTLVGEPSTPPSISPASTTDTDDTTATSTKPRARGAKGFYTASFFCMLMSIDTSWRFFGDVLNITWLPERIAMFAVLEVAFIACAVGMRANVAASGRPGAPRLLAWALCALAAVMAWQLSGFWDGVARITLGPVLGLLMLHLALGIERRAAQHRATTWARILREMRERFLSRFGLANDERDALARTRDRAARRAARLALSRSALFRTARLNRALRNSNIAHDPTMRNRMLAELAVARHADQLRDLEQESPWLAARISLGT